MRSRSGKVSRPTSLTELQRDVLEQELETSLKLSDSLEKVNELIDRLEH